ncbi:phosphoenolpyruvate synthase [Sporomusa malonica]|uniref:Phosphoenolpyruvate synthase n=1 Tax=Sporomusa malonica TaxID=112901 RepID=A0A1W2DYZ6_9FIRM|nr:phosphoenolpyruvate synthase [Sporomusa malonica]SMD02669.1 phosphoenolpyruvate synthase [Sporomusa malonica]
MLTIKSFVLFFEHLDRSSLPVVGGKGANLGELSKAGFPVPGGFCVTTYAYQNFIATSPEMNSLLDALNVIDPTDLNRLRELGEHIRTHLTQLKIPLQIKDEIVHAWASVGEDYSYAIRSSATAEDLPTASFAGQQDTYLNIRGQHELLRHVRKCWASLFTDRAIAYRAKNGFNHHEVYLSVVIQRMVIPEIAGIMFTADPVSGNRTVISIDASFGLGEAIVSGLVSADLYKVKDNTIIQKNIAQKKLAIYALSNGGTVTEELPAEKQQEHALADKQILSLVALGKKIEAHFGAPQDIEFCVEKGEFFIVQSRPITSLYPLPDIPYQPLRVLLSFGHVQMATDAMKPLGISVLRTIFPASVFVEAGGRLFIDLSDLLHSKIVRIILPKILTNADEAMSRALDEVVKRPEFLAIQPKSDAIASVRKVVAPIIKEVWKNFHLRDPKLAKAKVETYMQERLLKARQSLCGLQGAKLLQEIQHQLDTLMLDVMQNIVTYVAPSIIASRLLQRMLVRWLGNDTELSKLNKSLPGNVTSEMGLQIGDLADILRELPEVQEYLKTAKDHTFYTGLVQVAGGNKFKGAFESFIDKYGMRCPGEIDLTNPRWRETPTQLIPAIFSHMRSVKRGEHRLKFSEGAKEAEEAAQCIMDHLEESYFKSKLAQRLIKVFRYSGGLREHHKYLLIVIIDVYKQAIMSEAEKLVATGVLQQAEDVYFLTLDELIHLLQGDFNYDVSKLVTDRKDRYKWQQNLKPPRVMTSEGEIVIVPQNRGRSPEGALVGVPVSAGIVEGKARIILRPENAFLSEGEILVAPHTDPGWTPLFQSAKAVITEVGGLMTHGAVVAREYGIPAVVGVDNATQLIKDGDLIRVDGNQGIVEFLVTGKP